MGMDDLRWSRWCCAGVACALSILAAAAAAHATTTTTFRTPGAYQFTVPAGVTHVTVVAIGGAGGSCGEIELGGRGAAVTAEVPVAPGASMFVGVAGPGADCGDRAVEGSSPGGVGGGGAGGRGGPVSTGGGGASTVAAGSGGQGPLVVAGGGGGGGGANYFAGKTGNGADADAGAASGLDGGAGTATAGGRGGSGGRDPGTGQAGALGQGGGGGNNFTTQCYTGGGGGGGGGGLYGGGGGGACKDDFTLPVALSANGAGGGGSSFISPQATAMLGPLPTDAATGVSLTYAAPAAQPGTRALRLGAEDASQTLTVRNRGSAPLVVAGVMLSGADSDAFRIDSRCRRPVAPRSSCDVEVRLAPRQRGARSARLTLLTNAAVAPKPVTLSGGRGDRGRREAVTRTALIACPVRIADDPRYRAGPAVCRGRRVPGEIELTRATERAVLRRGAVTYATGTRTENADGSSLLALDERRTLTRGTYTLVLRGSATTRERVAVRPNATRAPLGGLAF
jgi:hypothetical protein